MGVYRLDLGISKNRRCCEGKRPYHGLCFSYWLDNIRVRRRGGRCFVATTTAPGRIRLHWVVACRFVRGAERLQFGGVRQIRGGENGFFCKRVAA